MLRYRNINGGFNSHENRAHKHALRPLKNAVCSANLLIFLRYPAVAARLKGVKNANGPRAFSL